MDEVAKTALLERLSKKYAESHHVFERFRRAVVDYFQLEPTLTIGHPPPIHSIKSRLKAPGHLVEKLERKWDNSRPITEEDFFKRVTDLCGVRVIHLHQGQFASIHEHLMRQVSAGDWFLDEPPKAYSWDPETASFFRSHGIEPSIKESYYTSVHYLVRPGRPDNDVCCEIQVRTLFEEAWGEIDHVINYPQATDIIACREQIRVLAKLVSTGSRLADAIFTTHAEYSRGARRAEETQ